MEADTKETLCCWLRAPRLLPFRCLLARVCGSMAQSSWDDGKTTLFSSVAGKLHLRMLDSMTRLFLYGKMSKCLNMVRSAVLSLRAFLLLVYLATAFAQPVITSRNNNTSHEVTTCTSLSFQALPTVVAS